MTNTPSTGYSDTDKHADVKMLHGMGYAQEYHVERLLREVLIPRTAPVSPHMILNFIAEKVLGLPKSY